jgi:hypothetical protein
MIAQPVKQLDFLGVEKRKRELSAEGDPLEVLARVIPWDSFRRGLRVALARGHPEVAQALKNYHTVKTLDLCSKDLRKRCRLELLIHRP